MKISVPTTLSLANNKSLKKRLVGKIPVERLWEIYNSLDSETEVAQSLKEEIESQIEPEIIEPEEDSGVVVLPISSIKALKTEIVAGLTSVGEKIDGIKIPESKDTVSVSNFPKPEKPLEEIKVTNFPKQITEISVSNFPKPIETLNLNEPKWYKAPDSSKTDNTIKLTGESVVGALSALQEAMHDPSTPLKVQIINKRGDVVENFGSVAISGGGGGGGSVESVKTDSAISNTVVLVETESTAVLSANTLRRKFIISNDGTETIYISYSGTAVLNEGYALGKGGSMAEEMYRGAISAISTTGSQRLCLIEI